MKDVNDTMRIHTRNTPDHARTALAPRASSAAYGRGLLVATLAAGALGLAACSGGAASGSSGGATPTISIVEPTEGATVSQPFTLKVDSSVDFGPTDTGKDHFHLTFDGNAQQYTVETKPEVMINSLSPGRHTIKVTLQHADHSPIGPEAQVNVTVANAGGGTTSTPAQGGGNGY
jgi:hypothetical protein